MGLLCGAFTAALRSYGNKLYIIPCLLVVLGQSFLMAGCGTEGCSRDNQVTSNSNKDVHAATYEHFLAQLEKDFREKLVLVEREPERFGLPPDTDPGDLRFGETYAYYSTEEWDDLGLASSVESVPEVLARPPRLLISVVDASDVPRMAYFAVHLDKDQYASGALGYANLADEFVYLRKHGGPSRLIVLANAVDRQISYVDLQKTDSKLHFTHTENTNKQMHDE